MTPKKNLPDVGLEDRRAENQDAAIEAAFVEGALPEEDRRQTPEAAPEPVTEPVADETVAEIVAVPDARTWEDRVEPGSQITRTDTGWRVALTYGGAIRLHGEGATLAEAITAAGA